jgi:hypothetical protein
MLFGVALMVMVALSLIWALTAFKRICFWQFAFANRPLDGGMGSGCLTSSLASEPTTTAIARCLFPFLAGIISSLNRLPARLALVLPLPELRKRLEGFAVGASLRYNCLSHDVNLSSRLRLVRAEQDYNSCAARFIVGGNDA